MQLWLCDGILQAAARHNWRIGERTVTRGVFPSLLPEELDAGLFRLRSSEEERDLVGDYGKYGQEISGDLLEGKRTLMLIHLLRTLDGDDRERVRLYLGKRRRERTDEEVRWLRELLDDRGSLGFARNAAIALARAALAEGEAALQGVPDSEDKDFLLEAARYVIERDR
jgi:geranylgeranyl diphosphate synthase type II